MYESIIFLYISYDLLFVFWVEGTNKNVQEYIHNRFYYKKYTLEHISRYSREPL